LFIDYNCKTKNVEWIKFKTKENDYGFCLKLISLLLWLVVT